MAATAGAHAGTAPGSLFGAVLESLRAGRVPPLAALKAARVFGTLVLSSDHADSSARNALARGGRSQRPGSSGFHLPDCLPDALRVGPPPFGYRKVASRVVTPLALVLGPVAVSHALATIHSAESSRAQRGFLPVVLAERLGVSRERVRRAIDMGASAHLVVWAGDPAIVRRDIAPGEAVAPSWLSPEDRALFATDRQEVFDDRHHGWAEDKPGGVDPGDPKVAAARARRRDNDASAAAEAAGAGVAAAGPASARGPHRPATGESADAPPPKLDGAAPGASVTAAVAGKDAAAAAGGPSPTPAADRASPLRVVTAPPTSKGPPRLGISATAPASSSAFRPPSARATGRALVPASWSQILSPAVRTHPAVAAFLGSQAEIRLTAGTGLPRSLVPRRDLVLDLLAPGGRLHRLPQPLDAVRTLRRRAASALSSPATSDDDADDHVPPARLGARQTGAPAATPRSVALASPHRPPRTRPLVGPLAAAVSEALASRRAAELLETSNFASDGFAVASDAAEVAELRRLGVAEHDDLLDEPEAAEPGAEDHDEARTGCAREALCLPSARAAGGEAAPASLSGAASSKGSSAGAGGDPDPDAPRLPPLGPAELRCHVSRLPRDGAVPGLLSPMVAERAFRPEPPSHRRGKDGCGGVFAAAGGAGTGSQERAPGGGPSPQVLRRLLYTLAGVPPMHASSGELYAGFGSDSDSRTGAVSHLYPNLALASLPSHLTWVVPAGTVADPERAREFAAMHVPKGEGMLLRSVRGGAGPGQPSVMDELCIFLCGGGRAAER